MTRTYADAACDTCGGTGTCEVVTPGGDGAGWVTCWTCHGTGDV